MTFLDLHIHTKYSLASSKRGDIKNFSDMAKRKGIGIIGTGDILHGEYFDQAKRELSEESYGIYSCKETRFLLTVEVSLIYRENEKCKKVHIVAVFPDFKSVEKAQLLLKDFGKLNSDGRPIIKMNVVEFAEKVKEVSDDIILIPAHIWTPHFGLLGAKSGYNSIPDGLKKLISALETGLSSDPYMCSLNKDASKYSFVSFSDAHSPELLGREATILEGRVKTIKDVKGAFENKKILGTVEFFPQEGKYFLSGHRACDFKTKEKLKECPVCGKPLTDGVLNRIKNLPQSRKEKYSKEVFYVLPIKDYVDFFRKRVEKCRSKEEAFFNMLERMDEMKMKSFATRKELTEAYNKEFADFCINVREKKILLDEGYDGVYGKIKAMEEI
ncbi:TPA: hypothetical protein DCW38_05655 [candidate division WOR-3 bacterium]|uniref:DNA helicase UvrD n=1 Tax=candidate division WOR-3 bacterium TaxID=2052148 RepID=A0A350HAT1_UNCW3|nr:hypothetical protein [candidate division WOR-3 bacterium]